MSSNRDSISNKLPDQSIKRSASNSDDNPRPADLSRQVINPDPPFFVSYLVLLALQVPIWFGAGLFYGGSICILNSQPPIYVLVAGVPFGLFMWLILGNFLAVIVSWRRSGEMRVADRDTFHTALDRVCDKLRLIVLDETADSIILGPRWVLIRLRLQEVRLEFIEDTVVLTAQAVALGRIKKELKQALAKGTRKWRSSAEKRKAE